ncbi:MAG TPA: SOS response-associated peptidase [Thermoanaerobaculia bacterium]|nr:SOS response-associated peptidase [Thermoanaerobaculia bacterium]HQR66206.1 SOS response-associated peptidase [Thermoanaerobaculia bacterium]
MCGRYFFFTPADIVAERFRLTGAPPLRPRYNIAPQSEAPVIVAEGGARRLVPMRWGLVPSWSKDAASAYRMINARAETAPEKPSFRGPFRRQRALVPADGFYEWKREGAGKRPFALWLASREPFAMAGLWDRWKTPEGGELLSFTILTTAASASVSPIHDRMPVILPPAAEATWLDPGQSEGALKALLVPFAGELEAVPLSTAVNNPRNDGPELLAPAG